jgi:hypothetical protein
MKRKLILCLALVLSGGLFGCCIARADETNAVQSYVTATIKTNWTDAKVTVYRATGGAVQLDAKREVVTVHNGPYYTDEVDVVAFLDNETGKAWVGSGFDAEPIFYIETESGIVCGRVGFLTANLGASRPDVNGAISGEEDYGFVIWDGSFVSSVKHGENVDAAIEQFNQNIELKSVERMPEKGRTILGDNLDRVENGLDPWLFQDEGRGSQFKETTVEAIDVGDGKLRLDLKSPSGSHKASIWIDLKTWKVVKTIQDGKSAFVLHSSPVTDTNTDPVTGLPKNNDKQP